MQLRAALTSCFIDAIETIQTFDEIHDCQDWMSRSSPDQTIFLIVSSTYAEKILPDLDASWPSIKKVYVFGEYYIRDADRLSEHRRRGVQIAVFELFDDLIIRLLRDLSLYYSSKAEHQKKLVVSGVRPAFTCFDRSKSIEAKIHELQTTNHESRMKAIERGSQESKQFGLQASAHGRSLEQQLQLYNEADDQNSIVLLVFIGYDSVPLQVDLDIGYTIRCKTIHQWKSARPTLRPSTYAIVVSSEVIGDDVPSHGQLIRSYFFPSPLAETKAPNNLPRNMTYASTLARLVNELHHQLGQHYRKRAMALSQKPNNTEAAKSLLQKSTKCYQLLKSEAEKAIKHYDELLKTNTKST